MLIGEYNHSIDIKGRTALPSKFKDEMGGSVFVTKGLYGSLDVFSKKSWDEKLEKMKVLRETVKAEVEYKRFTIGSSAELLCDKQGRILIPTSLREYVGIQNSNKLIWVGMGEKAEIWSEKNWKALNSSTTNNISKIVSSLDGII